MCKLPFVLTINVVGLINYQCNSGLDGILLSVDRELHAAFPLSSIFALNKNLRYGDFKAEINY
jgi:hypothetical protein